MPSCGTTVNFGSQNAKREKIEVTIYETKPIPINTKSRPKLEEDFSNVRPSGLVAAVTSKPTNMVSIIAVMSFTAIISRFGASLLLEEGVSYGLICIPLYSEEICNSTFLSFHNPCVFCHHPHPERSYPLQYRT
jgi:hypothetical protein